MTEHERAVLVERQEHTLLLTLNRPHALNAIDSRVATALSDAIAAAERDDSIRVIVLTGSGRAFCAGMDLKAFASGESATSHSHPEWGLAGLVQHLVSKPLIAAVNGHAYGLGAELALASDLVVVDPGARLAFPEVTRGLFAAAGGVPRLAQQIPLKIAMEKLLTGEPIAPEEALSWGLVNAVSEPGGAVSLALDLAQRIARNAPLAVSATKQLLLKTVHESAWSHEAWAAVEAEQDRIFASADALEGAAAFADKREPVWTSS